MSENSPISYFAKKKGGGVEKGRKAEVGESETSCKSQVSG